MTASALAGPGAAMCLVEVEGRMLAVEITHAREAREFAEITAVPLAPPALVGMANLRGAIVPVLDLRRLLALPPRPRARTTRTLVVETAGVRLALAVDRVVGVESFQEESGTAAADEAPLQRGHVLRGEERVPILDTPKILEQIGRWKA
jgi:purine-binding chemotaxis protein CheW